MIVADVNLVAYLLIDGEHTEAAQAALAKDPEWAAPLLWRSEWRNILAGYLRRAELDLDQALERMAVAESLFRGREFASEGRRVMQLVATSDLSAYDCEYAALADHLGVPLVSNDTQLVEAFPGRAQLLSEFTA
ncbi:MAG: type II toxin-antitoxin system VapC family toxin [Gemmatimonadetes bacterium]|nr:type II toxin-antitoxin system VapC family toxin [Gemmatimonadota bacterium]